MEEPHGAARPLDTPVQAGQASSSFSATGDVQILARPDEVPVAADEPPPEPSVLAGPDEITIDGVRVSGSSSLVVLKAACASLGLPQHGNRSQIFTRMVKHLEQQALLAAHSVKHRLQRDLEREPQAPCIPASPSDEEKREHALTHIPFRAWCPLCIAHKARQDHHRQDGHPTSTNSLVSFDFGFASRLDGDPDPLTVLVIHDRSTKSMHAVPTPSTGELCRFVTWIGHTSVAFRCGPEPSTIALLESAKKALKGLGVQVRAETIAPGNKQAAEVTVQVLRNQANLLVQQLEQGCGAEGKPRFSAHHPVYSWAYVHACWLHNRFAVSQGETPFERCTSRVYSGKICMFGEGYIKASAKGLPSWRKGVWLGKTLMNDSHLVACQGGLFVTRSVRRRPTPWSLDDI